jgi:tetratricopeptide (TPR) repeat protein
MEEAIEAYEASHRLEPGHPTAAHNLGESHLKLGQEASGRRWLEIAVESYSRQLEDFPGSPQLLARRALCRAWLGRYEEALHGVAAALEGAGENGEVLFRAGQVHALAGRSDEALDFARRAILAGFPREELRRDLAFGVLEAPERLRHLLETPDRQLSR